MEKVFYITGGIVFLLSAAFMFYNACSQYKMQSLQKEKLKLSIKLLERELDKIDESK